MVVPYVIGALVLWLSSCNDQPTEDLGALTSTLEPLGPPDVYINSKKIAPVPWEPKWSVYKGVCPSLKDPVTYHLPNSRGKTSAIDTSISFLHESEGRQSLVAKCNGFTKILDPNAPSILGQIDYETVRTKLREKLGIPISFNIVDVTDNSSYDIIQIGSDKIWRPFISGTTSAGIVEVDLETDQISVVWHANFLGAESAFLWPLPRDVDDKLVFTIFEERTINREGSSEEKDFRRKVIFDAKTGDYEGIVKLPSTPIIYDEVTVEGVPFSELKDSLDIIHSEIVIHSNKLYVAHSPNINPANSDHLIEKGLHSQSGSSTLSLFDIGSGDEVISYKLPLRSAITISHIEGTDLLAILGFTNSFLGSSGEEDGKQVFHGTPTIIQLDLTTNEVISSQAIAEPSKLTSAVFSEDGHRLYLKSNRSYYEYKDGSYQFSSTKNTFEVSFDEFKYNRVEHPDDEPISIIELGRKEFYLPLIKRHGINRDQIIVNRRDQSAYYFKLPIDSPCYEFSNSLNEDGTPKIEYSCLVEYGMTTVAGNDLYIGYGEDIWKTALPFDL